MMTLICAQCGRPFESVRRSRQFCSRACANAFTSPRRPKPDAPEPTQILWNSGGGVQSTALAVLICQGKLPRPDLAVMIDCGYESVKTLEYMHEIAIPRLEAAGVTLHMVRSANYVETELLDGN